MVRGHGSVDSKAARNVLLDNTRELGSMGMRRGWRKQVGGCMAWGMGYGVVAVLHGMAAQVIASRGVLVRRQSSAACDISRVGDTPHAS